MNRKKYLGILNIVVALFVMGFTMYIIFEDRFDKESYNANVSETATNGSSIDSPTTNVTNNEKNIQEYLNGNNNTITTFYYDEKEFNRSINSKKEYKDLEGTVVGIIPHHLVAADMISGFMEGIANDHIDTVVIIGPKHIVQSSKIITSDAKWSTALGTFEADKESVEQLIKMTTLQVDNNKDMMESDHAISSLVPYVVNYMPQAKIVPILLSGSVSLKEIELLVDFLTDISKEKNVLLLGSIDFSHYLNSKESAMKDEETKSLIENKHYKRIKDLGNDNLDSPNTLLTLMKYIDKMNYEDLHLVDHSSSLEKIGLPENSEVFKDGLTTYLIYASKSE